VSDVIMPPIGMLPGNAAFVLAGSQVPSLRQLTQKGAWGLMDFPLLLSLSIATLAPVYIRSRVRESRGKLTD
jgi:hypothetical protein